MPSRGYRPNSFPERLHKSEGPVALVLLDMDAQTSAEIQELMARFRAGDSTAAGALVDLFYPELRRLAAKRMSTEAAGHSWTPTVLVNELYLELVKIRALRDATADANERQEFLRLAGFIMRRLLIHHARPLYRKAQKVGVEILDLRPPEDASLDSLAEVESLMQRLAEIDPRLRRVAEMRVFEGKTIDEIGSAIGSSVRTVQSDWSFVRRWLERELGGAG